MRFLQLSARKTAAPAGDPPCYGRPSLGGVLGELSARRFDPCSLFPAPGLRGLERFCLSGYIFAPSGVLHHCCRRRENFSFVSRWRSTWSSRWPSRGKFFEENFELCTYDLLSTNFLPSTQCAALRVTIVFQPCRDSAPQMRPSEAAYAPVTTLTSRGRLGGSKRKKPCFSCHLFTNWWVLLGLSLTAFAVQTSKGALAWGLGEIIDCHQVGFDFRLDRKRVPSLIELQLLRRCGV